MAVHAVFYKYSSVRIILAKLLHLFLQRQDHITDPVYILCGKIRKHRECQHSVTDIQSDRCFPAVILIFIAAAFIGYRIEVLSGMDALFGKSIEYLVPVRPEQFFVKYCRVGAGDAIGDITGCELVCVLVGERPGLVTDKSMSAYITYKPHTGVSESSRTVVSNIHAQGTPAVEAGAHVAELIDKILKKKVSGVGLHLGDGA